MQSFTENLLLWHAGDDAYALDDKAIRSAFANGDRAPVLAAMLIHSSDLRAQAADVLAEFPDPDAPEASAWLAVASMIEEPKIEEQIDAWLADSDRAPVAIDALLRAEIDWYHPALVDHLPPPETGSAAATLLARSALDEFEEALGEIDDLSRLISHFRAAALADAPDSFDLIFAWRSDLAEDIDDRELQRIDAALATADPDAYARKLLMGDVEDLWLADDRAVADFLVTHGVSSWTAPLAIFREAREPTAYELTAAFAVSAALTESFDDVDDDELDPSTAAQWLTNAPDRVAFQLAIADDEDLAERLVAATLHQTLIERGLQPPAISGLPLSGPAPDKNELDAAVDLLDELSPTTPRDRVALLRSLTDLHDLVRQGSVASDRGRQILDQFGGRADAVDQLISIFDADEWLTDHNDWGARGIHHAMWQSQKPLTDALSTLATGWFHGPLNRISLYPALFAARIDAEG